MKSKQFTRHLSPHTHTHTHTYWSLLRARLSNLLRSYDVTHKHINWTHTHTHARIHIKSLIWHTNTPRLFTVSLSLSLGVIHCPVTRDMQRVAMFARACACACRNKARGSRAQAQAQSRAPVPAYHHDSTLNHSNLITDSVQLIHTVMTQLNT